MKILIISGTYPPDKCGVGDYTYNLIQHLMKINNSHEIYLLNSEVLLHNGKVISKQKLSWNIFDIRKVYTMITQINPDIINIQFPTKAYRKSIGVLLLIRKLQQSKFKTSITLHEYSYSSKLAKFRSNYILTNADKVIVVERKYKKELEIKKIVKSQNIEFLPISSNIPKTTILKETRDNLRNKYKVDLLIGYFGFINKTKGFERFIELCQHLKEQKLSFKALLIGELLQDNKYHRLLLRKIDQNDLKEYIEITGYLNSTEVSNRLSILDYAIFPFEYGVTERNGSVLAALNQNIRTIATTSEGFDNHFKNLYLVDKNNFISETMELICNNPRIESEIDITWDKIANDFLQIIRE